MTDPAVILPNLAFVGRAGAGKDTCAELIAEFGYTRYALADPLKDIAVQLWGTEARTDRDKLQKLGVYVREIQHDTWVRLLLDRLAGATQSPRHRVAVTDCRFPNEAEALRKEGFVFVRVMAPRNLRVSRLRANGKLQDEAQLLHESETALDAFEPDYHVMNEGHRAPLARQLVDILNREAR